ncbi:Zinc finger BED domain-containing protein 4 [Eumeta japonica]|uniref:Zinc finger BED domain-containing protein 4 n=1 Tax=Eumeta variegata TaxID=151549 RepID=A0A4C1VF17_EUMVA|nr:Zinc finger BED domain-containing protein 4 [Eumeta japonica]
MTPVRDTRTMTNINADVILKGILNAKRVRRCGTGVLCAAMMTEHWEQVAWNRGALAALVNRTELTLHWLLDDKVAKGMPSDRVNFGKHGIYPGEICPNHYRVMARVKIARASLYYVSHYLPLITLLFMSILSCLFMHFVTLLFQIQGLEIQIFHAERPERQWGAVDDWSHPCGDGPGATPVMEQMILIRLGAKIHFINFPLVENQILILLIRKQNAYNSVPYGLCLPFREIGARLQSKILSYLLTVPHQENRIRQLGKSVTPFQEAKKQLSLEEVMQKANEWDVDNVNSKKLDKLIGEMIALQNLPFNFVEGLGIRRLIQEIAPRYNFRGSNFFTEFVCKELYGKIAIKVKELIKKFDHMSFTSDIWSDPSSDASLLSLTCHGIASDFERSSIILKCETFDDRHTGDILAEKFDMMLSKWNISNDQVHCMIRDEGSNMKRAMRLAKLQDLDYAVHKMQLAIRSSLNSQENIKGIKQKCKKISTHFNHSTIAQKQLHKIQDRLNQPHLKVFQDCVTRWNSTYYMLERFLKAKMP